MSAPESDPIPYNPPLFVPWFAIGLLAVAFVLLALAVRGPNTLPLDLDIANWVQSRDGPIGEAIANIGNFLGGATFGLALLAIAWVGFALLRRRRELWFTAWVALGRLLAMLLKDLFDSPRPSVSEVTIVGTFDNWGFPSGHVTTATLSLGAIAWTIARTLPQVDLRLVALLWAIGVAMTAWARIWYGAHWFTDTIGGVLVGLIIIALASNLSYSLTRGDQAIVRRRSPSQTRPPSPPATG